jgi:hypothetical protein
MNSAIHTLNFYIVPLRFDLRRLNATCIVVDARDICIFIAGPPKTTN